jgi:hypothetical protein
MSSLKTHNGGHLHSLSASNVTHKIHGVASIVADETHRIKLHAHASNLSNDLVVLSKELLARLELLVGGSDDGQLNSSLALAQ